MIKNYIKIALRTMWRDRAFSLINLLGLSVGLASVIMIMAYVRYELSYDRHYSNSPYVYRLTTVSKINGAEQQVIAVPQGVAPALTKEFPSIKAYSEVTYGTFSSKYKGGIITLDLLNATPDFFKVFNFKFLYGNPNTSLAEPQTIVITESTVKKFFRGITDPTGRSLYDSEEKKSYKITGVIQDIPANTHFKADIISSRAGREIEPLNWQAYSSIPQYILLNKNIRPENLEAQFKSIYTQYKFPNDIMIRLQPVTSIHLYSHNEGEFRANSDIKYIYIFSCVALLILLIASINYINLTTARSIQRAREIGVRKVLGALRKQLITQFLSESFLFFAGCLLLGLLVANMCWPLLSVLINTPGSNVPLFDPLLIGAMILIVFVFGFISGIYPAFFLSKIKIAQVVKGVTNFGINVSFRKVLVAVQFIISGALIVSTLVIYRQLNYINNARLGFNKENLIVVPFYMAKSHVGAFKNELKSNSGIKAVTVAGWEMGEHFGATSSMNNEKDSTKTWKFNFIHADPDFIKTMGITVLKGRDFSRDNPADMFNTDSVFSFMEKVKVPRKTYLAKEKQLMSSVPIIINETLLKQLDIKYTDNTMLYKGAIQGKIIGMAQDFNGLSLHEKIPAIAITCSPEVEFGQMYIRISSQNTQQTIAYIQKKWAQFYPDRIFQFSFVDDKLQQLYSSDIRVGQLFVTFAVLAIVIACLGLFGLISLSVQQRVKEIGIRKVLGASVANITALLSADFLKLVAISFLIAAPIAWYGMNKWLQSFAYRINISWWIFALAGTISVLIAFITISFQAIKAALANPVKNLRSE